MVQKCMSGNCGLCTYFKKVFEGRQHIKADEYQMAHLRICYEIINDWY